MKKNNTRFFQRGIRQFFSRAAAGPRAEELQISSISPEPDRVEPALIQWAGAENSWAEDRDEAGLNSEAFLPEIEGLDTASALARIGWSHSLYRDLLQAFLRDVESNCILLETSPDTLGLQSFTIYVHGLKSALATIGAEALSGLAAMLEKAARQGDLAVIQDNLASFREGLALLAARIDKATAEPRSEIAPATLLREFITQNLPFTPETHAPAGTH